MDRRKFLREAAKGFVAGFIGSATRGFIEKPKRDKLEKRIKELEKENRKLRGEDVEMQDDNGRLLC